MKVKEPVAFKRPIVISSLWAEFPTTELSPFLLRPPHLQTGHSTRAVSIKGA